MNVKELARAVLLSDVSLVLIDSGKGPGRFATCHQDLGGRNYWEHYFDLQHEAERSFIKRSGLGVQKR